MRIAGQQMGLNENAQNAALREYMANGGVNLDPAVTAWCAAFVNASLNQAGLEGTGSNMARSFENWGVGVDDPQVGDLAVFWRESPESGLGHVGFFQGYDESGNILVLGGNQSDGVNVSPYSANQLLGFRRAGQPGSGYSPTARAGAAQGGFGMGQEQQNALAMLQRFQPRTTALDPAAFQTTYQPQNVLSMMPGAY